MLQEAAQHAYVQPLVNAEPAELAETRKTYGNATSENRRENAIERQVDSRGA
jgi:hypothetical protein